MNFSDTPLHQLENELANTERKLATLRAEVQRRRATMKRPGGAITMRDKRLALENLNTAHNVAPDAASAILTDC